MAHRYFMIEIYVRQVFHRGSFNNKSQGIIDFHQFVHIITAINYIEKKIYIHV